MADTQRTRAAILSLFNDNVTGQISAQDLRDYVVTIMESEFANPGDFWKQPSPKYTTTDKSARGWMEYSQLVDSATSFMNVVFLTPSGSWKLADAADSTKNGVLGLAMDSYTAGVSTAQILRKGIVYASGFSATWSGYIGSAIFLQSGAAGSVSITSTTNSQKIVGWLEASDDGGVASGKWRFDPVEWSIVGQ
jgi:hypothetical protein